MRDQKQTSPIHEPFVALPLSILQSSQWQELSPSAVKIYICLRQFSNGYHKPCWPSIKRLAADTHLALNTVRKALKELNKMGFIHIEENGQKYIFHFLYGQNKSQPQTINEALVNSDDEKSEETHLSHKKEASKNEPLPSKNEPLRGQFLNPNQKNPETKSLTKQQVVVVDETPCKYLKGLQKVSGMNINQIRKLINQYQISSKRLKVLLLAIKTNKQTLKNPGCFIIKALKENWNFPEIEKRINHGSKRLKVGKEIKEGKTIPTQPLNHLTNSTGRPSSSIHETLVHYQTQSPEKFQKLFLRATEFARNQNITPNLETFFNAVVRKYILDHWEK